MILPGSGGIRLEKVRHDRNLPLSEFCPMITCHCATPRVMPARAHRGMRDHIQLAMAVPSTISATKTPSGVLAAKSTSLLLAGLLIASAALFATLPIRWSAGLLAAALLGMAVLLRPGIGLVLLALALPFGALVDLPGLPANAVDLLVVMVTAAWIAQGLAARRLSIFVPAPAWPLLVFIWIAALSLTVAQSWRESIPEWLKWVEVAVVYIVGAQVLTRRQTWWMVAALLTAGVLEAMLGAYQFWQQVGPDAFILMGRFMRAYGTFGQPNPYAGYLGYLAPLSVSLAITAVFEGIRRRSWVRLGVGIVCAVAALAIIAGIGMSWSRGAWLALIAALVMVVGFRSRRAALATIAVILIVGAVLFVFGAAWLPASLAARVSELQDYLGGFDPTQTEITDANFSVLERIAHWQAGLAMFRDHPWLGVGIGNYAVAYADHAPAHWYEALGHAHNIAFHLLAETGVLGAASFLVYWLALATAAAWTAFRSDAMHKAYALGIFGTWVYVSIHGIFDNLFVQHMQLNLALLWAGLVGLGAVAQITPKPATTHEAIRSRERAGAN